MEGWAQAVAREFQSQDIANTLWAYAKMGTDIANTLWAYDKMRRRPGETSEPSGMIQQSVLKSCSVSLRNYLAPPLFSWLLVGRCEFF